MAHCTMPIPALLMWGTMMRGGKDFRYPPIDAARGHDPFTRGGHGSPCHIKAGAPCRQCSVQVITECLFRPSRMAGRHLNQTSRRIKFKTLTSEGRIMDRTFGAGGGHDPLLRRTGGAMGRHDAASLCCVKAQGRTPERRLHRCDLSHRLQRSAGCRRHTEHGVVMSVDVQLQRCVRTNVGNIPRPDIGQGQPAMSCLHPQS